MIRKYIFIILLFGITKISIAQPFAEKLADVDSVMANWNKPENAGGVIAIIQDGNVIYKKAFGLANIKRKLPNTIRTAYDLASNAKQFTAMCVALLEEQDKLSAEDDIRKFYPQFDFGKTVRIKNLLDHTSGIREAYVLSILSGKVNLKGELPKRYNTKSHLIAVLERERGLNFSPGDEMAYTNVNFILLGDIVEKVSGQSLRQFADSAIFKPLGMTHTFFRDKEKMMAPNEAVGYLYAKKIKPQTPFGGIVGDHNLVSTVDDLIRWDQNFYSNKLGNHDPLLIEKVCASSKLNSAEPTRYGYGLFTREYRGLQQVSHGGDNGQHTSFMVRFPQQKFSVICLANSSRYSDTEGKTFKIADIFLRDYLRVSENTYDQFKFISVSKDELENKTGTYTLIEKNGLGYFRKVMHKDGDLYVGFSYYDNGLKVSPVTSTYFVGKNVIGRIFHFHFSDSAGIITLKEQFMDRPPRIFHAMEKDLHPIFDDYRGVYFNASTEATIKIKRKKGKITARKGIIRIPLIPFDKDIFYAIQNDALFTFKRNSYGKVNQLTIYAWDFRNFMMIKK